MLYQAASILDHALTKNCVVKIEEGMHEDIYEDWEKRNLNKQLKFVSSYFLIFTCIFNGW